jgi:hypothetical protein
LQELSPFPLLEKEDQELLQLITKQWLNSKEWLNSLNKRKLLVKNLRVKFLLHLKKSAKSEFLSTNLRNSNDKDTI